MKLQSVQSLRGIAALIVVIYHILATERNMIERFGGTEEPLIAHAVANGFVGVDLFFVLSGFIIVYVTGRVPPSRHNLGSFLFARAARIYPPYWLFSLVFAAYLFISVGVPWNEATLAQDDINPAWHLIASTTLFPHGVPPLLGIGWTLVHEMHFYLVFGLLLFLPFRQRVIGLAAWGICVILGANLGLAEPLSRTYASLFFSPLTLEFLMGAGAALLATNGFRFRPGLLAVFSSIWLAVTFCFYDLDHAYTLIWGRVVWFGIPAAILVYGLTSLDLEGRFRSPPGLNALGDWSYALYLSHMLTINAIDKAYFAVANIAEAHIGVPRWAADLLRVGSDGRFDNWFLLISATVASIIVAWLTYRFFEQPALKIASALRQRLFAGRSVGLEPQPIRAAIW